MGAKSYIFTHKPSDCTGCGACESVCRHKALTMREDKKGFLYPLLDSAKCVGCGLCDSVCPAVNGEHQANTYLGLNSYLATQKDPCHGKDSATTGFCTSVGKYVLGQGGVVFAVVLDDVTHKAHHVPIEDEPHLELSRNSKYMQSDTDGSFIKVREQLTNNRLVLFVGTPCQVAGLKAYLRKPYDNLITIDIICHGVFSYKLGVLEVAYWENKFGGALSHLRFRSKRKYPWNYGGMVNFDIDKRNGKTVHYERHASCSPTYKCFAYSPDGMKYNLRDCCYSCVFRHKGRYGDITAGDAWGHSLTSRQLFVKKNLKNGISAIIPNTEKGKDIIGILSNRYDFFAVPAKMTFSQEALLPTHREIPSARDKIYEAVDAGEYAAVVESVLGVNLDAEYRNFLRRHIIQKLKFFVHTTHIDTIIKRIIGR